MIIGKIELRQCQHIIYTLNMPIYIMTTQHRKETIKTSEKYKEFQVPTEPKLEVLYSQTKGDYKGSILCVPGICHGAWCYEYFLKFFPDRGYDCYALSFRGHAGSDGHDNLQDYKLSDYSEDVKRCIAFSTSDECKHKMKSSPFLLGHSMGGAVVQQYIGEHFNTVTGAVLFASAPAGGMNLLKTAIDTYTHKNLHIAANKGSGKAVTDEKMFQSAFFDGRVPMDKIKKYNSLLQAESKKVMFAGLHHAYTDKPVPDIPILVIGSSKDSYFGEKELRKTADAYGCSENDTRQQLVILPDLCHDMMLDEKGWQEPAEKVLEFMDNNQ